MKEDRLEELLMRKFPCLKIESKGTAKEGENNKIKEKSWYY